MASEVKLKKVKSKKKMSKKKIKFLRGVVYATAISIVVGVVFGVFLLFRYFTSNPKFNVTAISVNGSEKYTIDEIIAVSEFKLGDNIFKASTSNAKKAILKLPYIASVDIDKKMPSEIKIHVTERIGKYVVYAKDSGQYVKVDGNGYILEIEDTSKISESVILFGVNFDDIVELGQKITDMELDKLLLYEKVKAVYDKEEIQEKITSVEFKNSNIILCLNDKLNVVLKDNSELEYSMNLLKTILKELSGKAGTIDMTLDNPTYSAI